MNTTRIRAAAMWLFFVSAALYANGCGDECADAKSLCEECELLADRCKRFDDANAEHCTDAVEAYEASCSQ